jgi:hypothetical protein
MDNNRIDALLCGDFSNLESASGSEVICRSQELCIALGEESAFEALLLDVCLERDSVRTGMTDQQWAAMAAPEPIVTEESISGAYEKEIGQLDWESIVENAFAISGQSSISVIKGRFSRHKILYLLAACITVLVTTGMALKLFTRPPVNYVTTLTTPQTVPGTHSIEFDTSFVAAPPLPAVTAHGQQVIRFSKATAAYIEKGTRYRIIEWSDSAVELTISGGSAHFTVEKNRYRQFRVHTPSAHLIVTGTRFSVDAGNEFSKVSVQEGSVNVVQRTKGYSRAVGAGEALLVNADSLILDIIRTGKLTQNRQNVVHGFPGNRGKYGPADTLIDNEMFVRYRNLRRDIFAWTGGVDTAVNTFAAAYPSVWLGGDLRMQLSRMHEHRGAIDKAIGQLDLLATGTAGESFRNEALYRKSVLLSDSVKDTLGALSLLDELTTRTIEPAWAEDVLYRRIMILLHRWEIDTAAEPGLLNYMDRFGNSPRADRLIFACAEKLLPVDPSAALRWYEYLVETCPGSTLRDKAFEGISKCLVTHGVHRHAQRAFSIEHAPSMDRLDPADPLRNPPR